MDLKLHYLYLLLGTPGSGKTHLLNYLMYQLRNQFSYGIVFTNTNFDNPFPYLPEEYIHPEYHEDAVDNLMRIQKIKVKKILKKIKKDYPKLSGDKLKAKEKSELKKVPNAFIIFDDCLENEQFKSETLRTLSLQLRHYHITVFMSSQYTKLIPPRFRTTAGGVFIFHNDTKINLNAMFESFGQRFNTYIEFKKFILDNLERQYTFIYYNKLESDPKLKKLSYDEKILFLFKVMICPPKIPKFSIKY